MVKPRRPSPAHAAATCTTRSVTLPGAVAVVLGGSRALGVSDEGSDSDLGLYYRGAIDLTARGVVNPLGSWGRVMNGGAWLRCGSAGLVGTEILFGQIPIESTALVRWVNLVADRLGVPDGATSPWSDAGREQESDRVLRRPC
jgi:hypothetical protein